MRGVLRTGGAVGMGLVVGVAATVLLIAALVGVIFLVVWLREPSETSYARTHVQALFVNDLGVSTGKVEGCRRTGTGGNPGEAIWACRVRGKNCVRTFIFSVDHEYGTQPYDARAFAATDDPCSTRAA